MNAGRKAIIAELGKRIIGQGDVIELVLQTLFVGGNSLIVGVPGLAKTLLVQTLAQVLDLKFTRIQFTPDLMPSDITGTDIIQEDTSTGRRQMVFAPGPIFSNIVLADEINRTPPKTQSALLEAMQEHRVTIQGRTYTLDEPFYVFATQNPIELEGTYPLPEAQLDRFMFHIVIEHPPEHEELEVVRATTAIIDPHFQRPITGADLVAVPASRPARADCRRRAEVRAVAGPHQPAQGAECAGIGEQVGGVRGVRARRAVPGARRQGEGAVRRPLSRELRRHQVGRAPRDAPPRPDELPRRVGGRQHGLDHRRIARARPGASVRNVEAASVADRLRARGHAEREPVTSASIASSRRGGAPPPIADAR